MQSSSNRRDFVRLLLASAAWPLVACAASHRRSGIDPASTDSGPDSTAEPVVPRATFVVTESFRVLLADYSCSGHAHDTRIVASSYETDDPVLVNEYHPRVWFRPSEMLALQAGEGVAFSSTEPERHGHCGVAWRSEDPYRDYGRRRPADAGTFECVTPPESYCASGRFA